MRSPVPFDAFFLGGVGDPSGSRVTLCHTNCARTYILDPAVNTLVSRAHIRFRISDLREATRAGQRLEMRIRTAPDDERLVPLIVQRVGGRYPYRAHVPWRNRKGFSEYNVISSGDAAPETEVLIYIVAR